MFTFLWRFLLFITWFVYDLFEFGYLSFRFTWFLVLSLHFTLSIFYSSVLPWVSGCVFGIIHLEFWLSFMLWVTSIVYIRLVDVIIFLYGIYIKGIMWFFKKFYEIGWVSIFCILFFKNFPFCPLTFSCFAPSWLRKTRSSAPHWGNFRAWTTIPP